MDRWYKSAVLLDPNMARQSRSSSMVQPHKTLRSPSLATHLSRFNSNTTYLLDSDTGQSSHVGARSNCKPNLYQSWSSRVGGDSAYHHQDHHDPYQNSSYLGFNYELKKRPEFKTYDELYFPYKSPSTYQPQSRSSSLYSAEKNTFTKPLPRSQSILNRYITSQLSSSHTPNNYESDFSRGRDNSISRPSVYAQEPLAPKYSYEPVTFSATSRYSNNLEDNYGSSIKPSLRRSQSHQCGNVAYRPASEVYADKKEFQSRPYYAVKKQESVVDKRTPSYVPVTPNLNYDYRSGDVAFSSVSKHYQPYQQSQPYYSLHDEQLPQDAKVVAASNVVSSRTSSQREFGDNNRFPSISRSSARMSATPMHYQESLQQSRDAGYTSLTRPERSMSVVVGQQNKHLSFVSRPRSIMVTNLPASSRPPSLVNSAYRHSPAILEHGNSIVPSGRSSVVGLSSSMFKVELPKRNSHIETKIKQPNYREQNENTEEDARRKTLNVRDSLARYSNMVNRYSMPENGSTSERNSHVEKRNSKTERRRNSNVKEDSGYDTNDSPKVRSYTGSIYRVHIPDSFTPTLSDTRKKAREVLCKIRNDPNYFSFK